MVAKCDLGLTQIGEFFRVLEEFYEFHDFLLCFVAPSHVGESGSHKLL